MAHSMRFSALFGLAACIAACGCTVGPKYQRAAAPVPAKWDVAEPWRESAPKDGLAKGEWWGVFNDDDLSALESKRPTQTKPSKLPPRGASGSPRSANRDAIPPLSTSKRATPAAFRNVLRSNFLVTSPVSE